MSKPATPEERAAILLGMLIFMLGLLVFVWVMAPWQTALLWTAVNVMLLWIWNS